MASFFANVQARTMDRAAVASAVEWLLADAGYEPETELYGGDRSVYIGPVENGWIGIYDSACTGLAVGPLAWLAQGLSARLAAPTLAWLVYDSSMLMYLLFDNGEARDRYISNLEYIPSADQEAPARSGPLGGDGERLLAVTGVAGDGEQLTRWLQRPTRFAQHTLRRVATALGQTHAELGHDELEADLLAEAHLERPEAFDRLEFTRVTADHKIDDPDAG